MTAKATFDFGNFAGDDILRVMREMQSQGIKPASGNKASNLASIRSWFLDFLITTLTEVGHLDDKGNADVRLDVEVDVDLNSGDTAGIVQQLWNARAKDWAVVETPITYTLTLDTFLHYFRPGDGTKQTVLSLGSGPGLYETFLGMLFEHLEATKKFRVVCVDFAAKMTRKNEEILKTVRYPIPGTQTMRGVKNVEPITGDMTALTFPDQSVDHVLCNNSLQWVPDWKKALAEMARVLKPGGYLYLFVHRHGMTVADEKDTVRLELDTFSVEDILDEIEKLGFEVGNMRQIGSQNGGQFGRRLDRVFVHAKYLPGKVLTPWRERSKSVSLSGFRANT